jgi:large subunit ribosomal protein L29
VKSSELAELRKLDLAALSAKEKALRGDLFAKRFQNALSQLRNVMEIRKTKKDIARIKTVAREKLAAAAKSSVSKNSVSEG